MKTVANANANKRYVLIALFTVYLVWGSTYLAIRYAIESIPPLLMAAARFLLAGGLLYLYLRWRGEKAPLMVHWKSAFIIGALLLGGGNGGVVWAEQTIPSGLSALLVSVVPLWMVLFDWLRPGGVRPRLQTIIGLLLGLIGLVVLVGPHNLISPIGLSTALIAVLIAPLTWALGSIYAKQAKLPSSAFMGTAMEMIAGGVVLFVMGLAMGEGSRLAISEISRTSWIGFFYLVFVGALVGFTAYIYILNNAPLSIASTYAYVNPVVAVILGWLFAGEKLTLRACGAGVLVLFAVALITFQEN
jgi:drug/metabolite transporter (DMT)-like permease